MEIRIRVWDGEKMWYPGDEDVMQGGYMLTVDGSVAQYRESVGDTCIEAYILEYDADEGCIPMLSTGLKDKNGKEMWEGDAVQYKQWPSGTTFQSVVAYQGREFKPNEIGASQMTNLVVIGNIHENPELLEEVA